MVDPTKNEIPTGLYWKDKKTEVDKIVLPFQTIETINESRATREKEKGTFLKTKPDTSWENRLIWGDNKYIMASLLGKFAGKIDLIYLDPPFATGADFSVDIEVGDTEWTKEPSAIEDKAYRDTWGKGIDSYLQMLFERLVLMRDLLSPEGSIYLHCDWRMNAYLRLVLDEVFGRERINNIITWQRTDPHNNVRNKFGTVSDTIYYYTKSEKYTINLDDVREQLSDAALKEYSLILKNNGEVVTYSPASEGMGRRFKLNDATVPSVNPKKQFEWHGARPSKGRSWEGNEEEMEQGLKEFKYYFRNPKIGAARCKVSFLDSNLGQIPQDIWINVGSMKGGTDYPTQKPETLLERIIKASTNKNDLVADFFCGSGTTGVVAETLGRRWIMADLSRYGIHTTRKRMLGIENCKPYVVQNLGKYERQYWQGVTFKKQSDEQLPIYEYIKFILDLYNAELITGMMSIHGKKGKYLVHVGAVDAPVTLSEIKDTIAEVKKTGQNSLDILGWEWEMGLHDVVEKEAKSQGINLRLFNIPRDVMDPRAVERGEITFYEQAYLEVQANKDKANQFVIELKDFAISNLDLIPEEVRSKVKKWSDYIDYWAVDWDFKEDTFHNMWQSYRTKQNRTLDLKTDIHIYADKGSHTIMVKVIDIFGNDTTHLLEVNS